MFSLFFIVFDYIFEWIKLKKKLDKLCFFIDIKLDLLSVKWVLRVSVKV